MTRDHEMQHQVQKAVRDYLSKLIGQRQGPGKGMACSSYQLMAQANQCRKEKPKSYVQPVNQLLAQTGMEVLQQLPRDEPVRPRIHGGYLRYTPAIKACTAKETNLEERQRTARHWMTWRNSPTPCPSTPQSDINNCCSEMPFVPTRPASAPRCRARPCGVRCRPASAVPQCDTPMMDELCNDMSRCRSATPCPPSPTCCDKCCRPITPQPQPGCCTCQVNSVVKPCLQAWVNTATDYERDVAYSLFQALSGKTPKPPSKKQRPHSRTAANMHYRNLVRKTPAGMTNVPMKNQEAYDQYRMGKNRNRGPTHRYTDHSSFFLNTMPPYKGFFVIHPDFHSEN